MYGSLTSLVIAYSIVYVSLGSRMMNSALIQIHTELEEAAYMSGASVYATLQRVIIPLLKPALANAWLWLALLAYRELTLPMILYSPDNMTLSVAVWSLWNTGGLVDAAAVAVVMMTLMLPMMLVYWLMADRQRLAV